MSAKVALVTGSNKGIGLAIVRALCKQFDGDVFLTARNEKMGEAAKAQLESEGLRPRLHHLDLLEPSSMDKLHSFLHNNYGGLDVLVNNAGIAYTKYTDVPFTTQARDSVATNFHGTRYLCDTLFPLLHPHARVVNLSSMVVLTALDECTDDHRKLLTSPDLTIPQLVELMDIFVESAKDAAEIDTGWPDNAYAVSKIGVTAMSMVHQRQFSADSRTGIIVNSCSPGYVHTDMTHGKGSKTPDEGARNPVYLSLLPHGASGPKGQLINNYKPQPWQA